MELVSKKADALRAGPVVFSSFFVFSVSLQPLRLSVFAVRYRRV